jgi:hypothetical protein
MDFFQFLQKTPNSQDESIVHKKPNKIKNTAPKDKIGNEIGNKIGNEIGKYTNDKYTNDKYIDNQETTLYKNIRRGDFIKIIHVKNSNLNSYKGYIGEIREYRKDQDSAVIFLHAIPSHNAIRFPIQHFIKID